MRDEKIIGKLRKSLGRPWVKQQLQFLTNYTNLRNRGEENNIYGLPKGRERKKKYLDNVKCVKD